MELREDPHLKSLEIDLKTSDEFNKNFNAVIDKGCQELESELRKLLPEGQKVDSTNLAKAVMAINAKLRRKESIAAYEMHTARQLGTGQNLDIDDGSLRKSQMDARRHTGSNAQGVWIQCTGCLYT